MKQTALLFIFLFFPALAGASHAEKTPMRVEISVSQQKLFLFDGKKLLKTYAVSTSKSGTGSLLGSGKTPLGRHRIKKKIGAGAAVNTIFENRVNIHRLAVIESEPKDNPEDRITSRILWLEGLEKGTNRGGRVDSFRRQIYIHGTAEEGLIGRPASHGCIRMKNTDVIDLYARVPEGTAVLITA